MPSSRKFAGELTPARLALLSFLAVILIGTLALYLPWSATGPGLSLVDSLFTATSAVCVTGLAVVDTGTALSSFGQVTVLLLIQAGGLGMMVWSSGVLLFLGGRLGLREKAALKATVPGLQLSDLASLLRGTVAFTLICEGVGVLLLWFCWWPRFGATDSLVQATFHAISAFCNAGFSLWGNSLMSDVDNPAVNIVIMALITLGGFGYLLLYDLRKAYRSGRRPTLHTRLALWVSLPLVLLGALLFYVFESSNPATLGNLTPQGMFWASIFQSVTCRTAGFNTVSIVDCRGETLLLMMFLMLIGGCPGSTAGGIKTTTFAILMVAIGNYLKGRQEVIVWERRVPEERVTQSLAILGVMTFLVWIGTMALCAVEPADLSVHLFESVSAVATVGLSAGTTGAYSDVSKLILCLLMLVGRVGPLTLAVSLVSDRKAARLQHVREDISVG